MRQFKDIRRTCKNRLIERLCDMLLRSGHFRRTVLRRLFQNHVSSSAMAYVGFPDHEFLVDPRDHMIAFSLVSGKTWQRNELNRAIEIATKANTLRPNGWFLDVGANIGTQTIYALLSGKFRGVIAIEPEPRNVRLLRRNVELNGFKERVHIIEAAASASSGTIDLIRDMENLGAHTVETAMPTRRADTIAVRMRSVDDTLATLGIPASDVALALIDVEGHEIEVLKGMGSLRQNGVPIVAELTGKLHGEAGMRELRSLLDGDYSFVCSVRDSDWVGGRSPARPITTYDFGLRQTDVLIYNECSLAAE